MNPAILVLLPFIIINSLAKTVEVSQDAYKDHQAYVQAHPNPVKKKKIKPPRWGRRSIERFLSTHEFVEGEWREKQKENLP